MVKVVESKAREFYSRHGLDTTGIPYLEYPPLNLTVMATEKERVNFAFSKLAGEVMKVSREYYIGTQLFLEGRTAIINLVNRPRDFNLVHQTNGEFHMKPVHRKKLFNLVIVPTNSEQRHYERLGYALMVTEIAGLSVEDEDLAFAYVDNSLGLVDQKDINPRLHQINIQLTMNCLLGQRYGGDLYEKYTLPFNDLYYRVGTDKMTMRRDINRWREKYPWFDHISYGDVYIIASNRIYKRVTGLPEVPTINMIIEPDETRDDLSNRLVAAGKTPRQIIVDDIWPENEEVEIR